MASLAFLANDFDIVEADREKAARALAHERAAYYQRAAGERDSIRDEGASILPYEGEATPRAVLRDHRRHGAEQAAHRTIAMQRALAGLHHAEMAFAVDDLALGDDHTA